MILKNYSFVSLLWVFPVRIILELIALSYAIVTGNRNWAMGVLKGIGFVIKNFNSIWKKHNQVQNLRTISDSEIRKNMFKGSVALTFFLRLRTVRQISRFKKKK
jgi:hypothetical protein